MSETELDVIDRVLREHGANPSLAPIILSELTKRKMKVLISLMMNLDDIATVRARNAD